MKNDGMLLPKMKPKEIKIPNIESFLPQVLHIVGTKEKIIMPAELTQKEWDTFSELLNKIVTNVELPWRERLAQLKREMEDRGSWSNLEEIYTWIAYDLGDVSIRGE